MIPPSDSGESWIRACEKPWLGAGENVVCTVSTARCEPTP